MKEKLTIVITAAVILGIGAGVSVYSEEGVWHLRVRALPPPSDVSDTLRRMIMASPPPNLAAAKQAVPKNETEWLAAIAANERDQAPVIAAYAKNRGVTIERDSISGVGVHHVMPAVVDPKHKSHLYIDLHGGAYVFNGGEASMREAVTIADRLKIPVLAIDYRMPPKHPFPAAVNDVVAVYKNVLRSRPAKSIAMGGTSAGGGLALAAVRRFRQLGLEVPGALYEGSPWTDLTKTGDSYFTNEGVDRILVSYDGLLGASARLYAGVFPLKDPLISPVYGDFTGFPPTYLVSGTRDLFLSNTARTHQKLRAAGVVADLLVFEGLAHAEYMYPDLLETEESKQVYGELNGFLLKYLQK